ncbi:MAG: hypothetical protein ACXWV0_08410 [Flavisolibacter sp.]
MRWLIPGLFLSVILAGCKNEDKPSAGVLPVESIFFDYVIKGEEDGLVTVKLQYRNRGLSGDAINLGDSGSVLLDGHALPDDSSGMSGVYYDTSFLTDEFKGTHSINVKTSSGGSYQEKFEFIPFELADSIPERVKRSEWLLRLKGLPTESVRMRIILTDTSFLSSWINQQIPVENGEIRITEAMWSRLKSGPIGMELHLESARRIRDRTRAGGRLTITYSLKREFILVD